MGKLNLKISDLCAAMQPVVKRARPRDKRIACAKLTSFLREVKNGDLSFEPDELARAIAHADRNGFLTVHKAYKRLRETGVRISRRSIYKIKEKMRIIEGDQDLFFNAKGAYAPRENDIQDPIVKVVIQICSGRIRCKVIHCGKN